MQKKLFGILLALCMLLSLCFAISAAEVTHVTEVPEGYTGISDEAGLQTLMDDEGLSGKYILMSDITLTTATTQSPIGTVDAPFTGIFDGNNYSISGINIVGSAQNAGFFGVVKGATIKNLTVTGTVTNTTSYAGGLIGRSAGSVTISDVTSNITVTNTKGAGDAGFIGYADVSAADVAVTITNCVNNAAITGTRWVAGFIGYITGAGANSSVTLTNCINNGTIKSTQTGSTAGDAGIAGGLLGYVRPTGAKSALTVRDCTNNGGVSALHHVGGMIGYLYAMATTGDYTEGDSYSVSELEVTRCKNTGNLTATNTNAYVGGMIGSFLYVKDKMYMEVTLTELYNSGTISGSKYAGAIFGIHRPTMKPADGVLKYTFKDWMNVGTASAIIGGTGVGGGAIWSVSDVYDVAQGAMIGTVGTDNNFTSANILSSTVTGETGSTFVQTANAGTTKAWGYGDKQSTPALTFVTECVHIWETTETTHTCDCGVTGEHAMTDGMCSVCAYSACTHESATLTSIATPATCLNVGWGTYTCETCGNTFEAEIAIDANNHEGEVIYIGTTTGGMKTYDCHSTVEVESYSISEDKVIDTANEILALMLTEDATVLGGTYTVSGTIDLSGLPVQDPIGDADHPFTGSIDGNNAVITGIAIEGGAYSALIGATKNATIKNLTVTGFVKASTTYAAGLVGRAYDSLTITNVTSNVDVTGAAGVVAGFVGHIVTDTDNSVITITDSVNNGTITGTRYLGGFVGYLVGAGANCGLTVTNCVNYGDVVGNSTDSNYNGYAGIIGYLAPTYKNETEGYTYGDDAFALSITKCANYGNISNAQAVSYAAGIIGTLNLGAGVAHETVELSELYNAGTMSANHNGAIIGIIRSSILNSEGAAPFTLKNWKNDTTDLNMIGYIGSFVTKWTLENVYNANTATIIKGVTAVSGTTTKNSAEITFTNCFVKDGDADAFAVGAAESKAWMYDAAKAPMLAFMAEEGAACTHDYTAVDDATHTCICGDGAAHNFDNSTCTVCGHNICDHADDKLTFKEYSAIRNCQEGTAYYTCSCGIIIEKEDKDPDTHIAEYAYLSTATGGVQVYACHNEVVVATYTIDGVIDTAEEILALMITEDDTLLAGDYVMGEDDIDLSTLPAQFPIGNVAHPFTGTFNGNGKAITGLDLTVTDRFTGLFGVVGNTAEDPTVISNLTVNGTVAVAADTTAGGRWVCNAGLAGVATGSVTITDCVNNANVSVEGDTALEYSTDGVAGILGGYTGTTNATITITNCVNNGSIYATRYAGGILGMAYSGDTETASNTVVTITGCTNNGALETEYSRAGGIVGGINDRGLKSFKIEDCVNNVTGTVKVGTEHAAGILGQIERISAFDDITSTVTINRCANYADITAVANYACGIVGNSMDSATGYNGTISFTNLYSEGTLTAAKYAAGVIGLIRPKDGITYVGENWMYAGSSEVGMFGYLGSLTYAWTVTNVYNAAANLFETNGTQAFADTIKATANENHVITLDGYYYKGADDAAKTAFAVAAAESGAWMYDADATPTLAFLAEEGTDCAHVYSVADTDTHTCICGETGEHDGKHTACTACGYLCENTEAYVAVENGYKCTACGTVVAEAPAAQVLYTADSADNKLTVAVNGTGFGIAQFTVNLPEGFTMTGWETDYASSAGGWLITGVDAAEDGTYAAPYNFAMLNIPTAAEDGSMECVNGDLNAVILTISYTAEAGATGVATITDCEAYAMDETKIATASIGTEIACVAAPVAGDVSGDGKLTVVDALLILKAILNGDTLANADMNGDNTLSLADVMIVLKKI